jgi:hypothetical protein
MWSDRLSHFILIKLRYKWLSLALPVPLFIFTELLQAAADLAALWESFFPRWKLPGLLVTQLLAGWLEFRRLGSWQLAEVAHDKHQLSISFF